MEVRYQHHAPKKRKRVFFNGSTALIRGQAVAYDRAATSSDPAFAATDSWEKRDNQVAAISSSNHRRYAGISYTAYPAVSGGQWIEITSLSA